MKLINNNINVDVAPLSGAITIVQGNASSPLMQVFDGMSYNPNRTLTPCPIIPRVELKAVDAKEETVVGNEAISTDKGDMDWLVDGHSISDVAGFKDAYEISDGKNEIKGILYPRGTLILKYNIPAGQSHTLVFKCSVVDPRNKKRVVMKSEAANVSTFDKSEDVYVLSMEGSSAVVYNPWVDELSRLEYEKAHGNNVADSSIKTAKAMPTSYLKTWTFSLKKGTSTLTAGKDFTMVYFINEGSGYVQIGDAIDAAETPVTEYDNTHITLDLRLMETCSIMARAMVGNRIVGEKTFGSVRVHPTPDADYLNTTSVNRTDKTRYDTLIVNCCGNTYPDFARLMKTIWHVVRADNGEDKIVGYGNDINYSLRDEAGLNVQEEGEFSEYADINDRPAHSLATDKSGKLLTDKSGSVYIFH